MPLRSDSENFPSSESLVVGGGGSNAVNRMIRAEMMGVEFIALNTDAQALLQSDAPTKDSHRGQDHTRSWRWRRFLSRPEGGRGRRRKDHRSAARLGHGLHHGRTGRWHWLWRRSGRGRDRQGSRAALTIGVVTKPFSFEGVRRKLVAERAAGGSQGQVDTMITIPNDRLRDVVQKNTSMVEAFRFVDDVLRRASRGSATSSPSRADQTWTSRTSGPS